MPSRVVPKFGVLRDWLSSPNPFRNRVELGIRGNAARRWARHVTCTLFVMLAVGVAAPARAQGQSQTPTYYATYELNGGTATKTGQTYSASAADTSGMWVTNSGALTLQNCIITTTGNSVLGKNLSRSLCKRLAEVYCWLHP